MSRSGQGIPAKNSRAEKGVRHCFQLTNIPSVRFGAFADMAFTLANETKEKFMPAYRISLLSLLPQGEAELWCRVDKIRTNTRRTASARCLWPDVNQHQFGSEVLHHARRAVPVQKPAELISSGRQTPDMKILYPKDIWFRYICMRLGIEAEQRSSKRGTESSSLTSPVVVLRHDRKGAYVRGRENCLARRNLEWAGGAERGQGSHALWDIAEASAT